MISYKIIVIQFSIMTPWNLTHDQWSKNLTKATDSRAWNLPHGQWSKCLFCGQTSWLNQRFTILTIGNSYFVHGYGQNGYFCAQVWW